MLSYAWYFIGGMTLCHCCWYWWLGKQLQKCYQVKLNVFFFQFPTFNVRRLVLAKYFHITKKNEKKEKKIPRYLGNNNGNMVSVFFDFIYVMSCLMVKCMSGEITYYMASWLLLMVTWTRSFLYCKQTAIFSSKNILACKLYKHYNLVLYFLNIAWFCLLQWGWNWRYSKGVTSYSGLSIYYMWWFCSSCF